MIQTLMSSNALLRDAQLTEREAMHHSRYNSDEIARQSDQLARTQSVVGLQPSGVRARLENLAMEVEHLGDVVDALLDLLAPISLPESVVNDAAKLAAPSPPVSLSQHEAFIIDLLQRIDYMKQKLQSQHSRLRV